MTPSIRPSCVPGDRAKLMWSVKRMPGERMWVTVTHRDGDNLTGTLDSWAVFAFLHPGQTVTFHIDDIIEGGRLRERRP